jgi:hypothetical protein
MPSPNDGFSGDVGDRSDRDTSQRGDRSDKKKQDGPFDPDINPDPEVGGDDAGIIFAGETEEEARKRRAEGGKSKRPEEIRVQQGGLQGTGNAGVQTEENGRQTRGGLAI